MDVGRAAVKKTTATLTTQRPAGTATTSLEMEGLSRSGCRNWTALVEWRLAPTFHARAAAAVPRPLPRRGVPSKGGKTVGARKRWIRGNRGGGSGGGRGPSQGRLPVGFRCSAFFPLASRRKQANAESALSNARHPFAPCRLQSPHISIFRLAPRRMCTARDGWNAHCALLPEH